MNAPFAAQEASEVARLIKELEACSKKTSGGKSSARCKRHTFDIAETSSSVDSWRFQEWDYKRRDLPSYARGLFTYRRKDGTPEIAVRGYDKFFNQGEVHETKWGNVESNTKGPYELSVKENGCIIFLGGMEDDHLLVCSKHSTGSRQDADLSHAVAGEKWVDQHLNAIGKTRADLARDLRTRNVTAVAELCDDRFEEHVLTYEPKDAGLYLHGINLNLPEFATYPGELVHDFADQWGFKKADYLIKDDVSSMKTFLNDCAETGSYGGRDTEGFVIRCQRKEHGVSGAYQDWFFKFKFDEPYLMYRQWRECTKAIISGKAPKIKKHQKITAEYLQYAKRQLVRSPQVGKDYQKNHGIIAMREGFLEERGVKGSDIIRQEEQEGHSSTIVDNNVLLLPVASIGCGKTTVALALTKLFGWGHVQNDNITGKSGRPKQFTTQVCSSLAVTPVCIGDRNNHQKRERKQIIDDVLAQIPEAKFVALHYVHDPKPEMIPMIREITQERIFARGDNHQTIQAGTKSRQEITSIMEGFLNRFEPVNPFAEPDDAFDEIINLDVSASSRENLETVVSFVHNRYPQLIRSMPSPEELDDAIDAALNDYIPVLKHDLSFKSAKGNKTKANHTNGEVESAMAPQWRSGPRAPQAPPKPEYYCVKLPTDQVNEILNAAFPKPTEGIANMYHDLKAAGRVQHSFHVTLIHRLSLKDSNKEKARKAEELWQDLSSLHKEKVTAASQSSPTFDPVMGTCRVKLEAIVWDGRVMCIAAKLLDGFETINAVAHVTIGTADRTIPPVESNRLLKGWPFPAGSKHVEKLKDKVLSGDVRVVHSR